MAGSDKPRESAGSAQKAGRAKQPAAGRKTGAAKPKAKGQPKRVTESLDTSSRRVGPLSIFGISDLWRVPTILPKQYEDLTRPVVEYARLAGEEGWVCVGGTAVDCEALASEMEESEPSSAAVVELAAGDAASTDEEAEDVGDEDASVDEGDAEGSEESSAAIQAEAAGEEDGSSADDGAGIEVYEAGEDGDAKKARLNKWRVTLADMSGRGKVSFDVLEKGAAERSLIQRAQAGSVLWVYGRVVRREKKTVLAEAQEVEGAALGEVQAYYPSKERKEYQKPVRKKGAKRPAKGKWIIRRMSSNTAGVLVRDKNRFAIARCAQSLRERLGLQSPADEWLLMKTIESPGPTLEATLKVAHRPHDVASGIAACRALERLAAVEIIQRIIEDREKRPHKETLLRPRRKAYEAALELIERNGGIKLTDEQKMCATEILVDLASEKRTHRMLSGDVGTGKTLVFAAVAATLCADDHLVVVLAPRSSLALQTHRKLKSYFPDFQHQVVTGETKERKSITAGMLVGTTGVWSRLQASGCAPVLIIADEQQKFGVAQRQPFSYGNVNQLESTATAIPRTQALMEFGGMEVSRLTRCHVQKTIETKVVEGKEARDGLYAGLKEAVDKRGRNLLLIYPVIDGSSDDDLAEGGKGSMDEEATPDAINKVRGFWEELFPGRVDVIHGRLSEQEREGALRKFESGKSSVMIGTSIMEVGIDLPKADMMVIHHPERLGVSAVHQLGGRLARQGGHGWCYLAVGNKISEDQLAIMKLMEVENNGEALSQADMVRRGFGDMRKHAKQQSGLYQGFLVDRPPSIEDIEWVQDHCRRWLGGNEVMGDLLDDTEQWMEAASKLHGERKTSRQRKDTGASTEKHLGEQPGLFDD